MADTTAEDDRERLKSALWFAVGQMVDEESMRRNLNATPQFIGALTELVWTQIENVAVDLESFSRHAGRSTVTTDDVLLLARKNPDLQQLMGDYVDRLKATAGTAETTNSRRGGGGARAGRAGRAGGGRGGRTGGA
ncbi:MHF histone-fold complex component [Purpureocillium takamizusanense]|uniref:MHF histone-fold complex component n=2 Tax=Purpureocillium takamizusanense TaxID=2060973 RepID=A0A9Q8VBK0_9HYPO|nr:MHF histone-fold complex component [Purpureocillium takamizusanense]UNI19011.1 MHF histone-fold complex component [Purpureocillium takamizusanense]